MTGEILGQHKYIQRLGIVQAREVDEEGKAASRGSHAGVCCDPR
jgi:hypothetical protein